MLVRFISSTSGQVMMFAQVARQLLEILGKDCSARGVITAEQVPEAIARLRHAAKDTDSAPATHTDAIDSGEENDADVSPVGLGQRAYPLIELLEWTRKDEGFILWEAHEDF